VVAAQANVQIDAEIGKKDHFRMETEWFGKEVTQGACQNGGYAQRLTI